MVRRHPNYACTNGRHKARTPSFMNSPGSLMCGLLQVCLWFFKIPSNTLLAFKIRILDCHLFCLPSYVKILYMQRLYSSFFLFLVHSKHALNLLLCARHDDGNDVLDALSCAEDICDLRWGKLSVIVMLALTKISDGNFVGGNNTSVSNRVPCPCSY